MKTISILTATYNRKQYLKKLYESLKRQTSLNFEWIVIDDGSSDGTKEIFLETDIMYRSGFEISYIFQENGGKHRAINVGVKNAKGDYIFIVDSDDYLADDAIEKVIKWIEEIDTNRKIAGVAGLRAYSNGKIIGGAGVKNSKIICSNIERKRYNLFGDKAEVYRRDLLLENPFPEIPGEKFISEEVVWNKLAGEGYKLVWFPEIIYYTEYLQGGLTDNVRNHELEKKNFEGHTIVVKNNLRYYKKIRTKCVITFNYLKLCRELGISITETCERLEISIMRLCIYSIIGKIGMTIRKK